MRRGRRRRFAAEAVDFRGRDVAAFRRARLAAIAAACVDPEIARFVPVVPQPYSEAHALAYVVFAAAQWASGQQRPFAIVGAVGGGPARLRDLPLLPSDR